MIATALVWIGGVVVCCWGALATVVALGVAAERKQTRRRPPYSASAEGMLTYCTLDQLTKPTKARTTTT